MKKAFSVMLSIILIFGILSCGLISANALSYGEYLTYKIENGQVTVTDCLTSAEGEIVIPETIENLPVTKIDEAFYGCDKLTSIVIPDTVTIIAFRAFYGCTALEKLTIPFIGKTFGGTENTHFGYIFGANKHGENKNYVPGTLKSIIITKAVEIDYCAFYGCENIESVTLPPTLKTVGQAAFDYCTALKAVYISDLAAWCDIYFGSETSNPVSLAQSLYLNGQLITDLIIPDGVTTIREYAFFYCESIKTVSIPPSVDSIFYYAFAFCTKIEKVNISDLSAWCDILFSDKLSNPIYYSGNLYLNGEHLTKLIVPEDVTELRSFTFTGCKPLTEIIMNDNIIDIGISAFEDCTELTNIKFSNKLRGIPYSAFKNCYKLANVDLPDSLHLIDTYAFGNCTSLKEIVLPKSVSNIHSGAFNGCSSLESITVPFLGQVKHSQSSTHLGRIFGAENYYENAYYVPKSLKTINITNALNIYSNDFYGCSDICEVNFTNYATYTSDCLQSIAKNAFNGCTNLKTVSIPDTVTSIDNEAFSTCNSLEKIKCHNNSYAQYYANLKGIPYVICCDYKHSVIIANLTTNGKIIDKCDICFDRIIQTIYRPATIKLSVTSYTYNGKVKTPTVIIKDANGKSLIKNKDYILYYSDGRIKPGTHSVCVDFIGNYSGTEVLTFKINPIPASKVKATLSATKYIYNGKVRTPAVTVKNASGVNLVKNKDYTIKYSTGRKNVGKYKVTITFKGNYSGSKTLYFTIRPKSISIKSISAGNKSLKVKVSKRTVQVTGYQIHYSTSKIFKNYKYKYITNFRKDTFDLGSLSAKKTYYVRVRSYKKIGNVVYYSPWSTVKYKKTK